jgi:hypothetical protein
LIENELKETTSDRNELEETTGNNIDSLCINKARAQQHGLRASQSNQFASL